MKLFSTVVLLEQVLAKSKLAATCDISHLFEGSETIYNVKCENDYGNNYSENKQVLRLFTDLRTKETEAIRCIVTCKYDLDQKQKIVIRAATGEDGKCHVVTPKKLDGLCGKGCSSDPIKEKMGSTTTRHSCRFNTHDQFVQPGDSCKFSCQTDEGEFLNTESELRCTCKDGESGRECDWTVGKNLKPIDSQDKNGSYLLPTLMGSRDDEAKCSNDMDCAPDEYLAVTHPDYLYGNMLDYYMADPEEYGFNLSCIKRQCGKISLEDIACFDSEGNELKKDETYPEGTRCGRKCDLPGYSFDHSPTDKFVGNEKYTATTGGHGKYNFIPASDAVCTCGHQYSWPRQTHDYYGEFYPDEYFGAYCEWNYGNGPLSDYKPVLKKALQQEPEQLGNGVAAAAYLATCKPNFCKADMVNDEDVKSYIVNHMNALYGYSDYGPNQENGFQHVVYSVDGVEFQYGFEELWNFREVVCNDNDRLDGDQSLVGVGTICQLTCKEGYSWLPGDTRSDEIECIGMYSTYGVGAWDWMPDQFHPGYGSPRLDLRVCVPNNYFDRDGQTEHQML